MSLETSSLGPMTKSNVSTTVDTSTVDYVSKGQILQGLPLNQSSLTKVLRELTMNIDSEDSFFVADIGEVYSQFESWVTELPRVIPHFAVKSNPDPAIIKILASLGTGFDCASKAEIKLILDAGVSPDRIIYAHPCKPTSHLLYAKLNDVQLMTFDNENELHKISAKYPSAKIVLRIGTDDSNSLCRLSLKFGAPMSSTFSLLKTAKLLNLDVVGVSFHVGSGCNDDNAFTEAITNARTVFDQASQLGYNLSILDIGGGFPSPKQRDGVEFKTIASNINNMLDKLFPPSMNIKIISEPGRFFSSSPFSLAVNVTSKRAISNDSDSSLQAVPSTSSPSPSNSDDTSFMYYINDGVYGSFNCIMFDHQIVYPQVLVRNGSFELNNMDLQSTTHYNSSIWGPTCDSIDCVASSVSLPELFVGDWILFQNMGAYTGSAASKFNGFEPSQVYYYNSKKL
ncbi:Antizyme inhibitor 2 [Smittium culicis]|uniref:ornithine decarboxylase n=1 Tax=Smittium culicis TaxID=133412 RepID=A0A1R1XX62_9FUNG|nr:Antizyme inhibitor 2 [Smittium culicis]